MSDVPPARPSHHRLVYRGELTSFLSNERLPDPRGSRALVLLADADGYVEAMVICTVTRRINSQESTVLLLLDGEFNGEPITSVAYTEGSPFPITSAGRRCIVHVDNEARSHVDDMQRIWEQRLPNWVPRSTTASEASP